MFKKSKSSSGFKNSTLSSSEQDQKATLEQLGYAFSSASKKSGWNWSTESDQADGNLATEGEAIHDAWTHAGRIAQATLAIPDETWTRMGVKEQTEMINEAFEA